MPLLKIAVSNIRKKKANAVIICLFTIIMMSLLCIATQILFSVDKFMDQRAAELNSPGIVISFNKFDEQNKYISYITQQDGVDVCKELDALRFESALTKSGDYSLHSNFLIAGIDDVVKQRGLEITEEAESYSDNSIFLPYVYKIAGNLAVGDEVTLECGDVIEKFEVAGFFEDVYAVNSVNSIYTLYVSSAKYAEMTESYDAQYGAKIFDIYVKDGKAVNVYNNVYNYANAYGENWTDFNINALSIWEYNDVKSISTIYINIVLGILMEFAVILGIITLFVIQFTMKTILTKNIRQIGMLKAIGYSDCKIYLSVIYQFLILMLTGSLLSLGVIYLIIPKAGSVVSATICLNWKLSIDYPLFLTIITAFAIIMIVSVYLGARRFVRRSPIDAVLGIKKEHNKKVKSGLSLETHNKSVGILLGFKSIMRYRVQSICLALLTLFIVFIMSFSAVLYHNFVTDNTLLMKMLGFEYTDYTLKIKSDNVDDLLERVEKMEEVEKLCHYQYSTALLDENSILLVVSRDFEKINNSTIVTGRLPKNDDEIVLTQTLARKNSIEIGDYVEIKIGNELASYKVVGLNQMIMNLGYSTMMTEDGVKRCIENFKLKGALIYLKAGTDNEVFEDSLEQELENTDYFLSNEKESIDETMTTLKMVIEILSLLMLFITAFIVILIIYLMIKTREDEELVQLGIKKALGFSNKELILQLLFGIMPNVLAGVVLGVLAAKAGLNHFISFMLSAFDVGLSSNDLLISLPHLVFCGLLVIIISLIGTFITSLRIKKISPAEILRNISFE